MGACMGGGEKRGRQYSLLKSYFLKLSFLDGIISNFALISYDTTHFKINFSKIHGNNFCGYFLPTLLCWKLQSYL